MRKIKNLLYVLFILIFCCASDASAGATYNSEKNIVELATPILAKNTDWAYITIYSDKLIKLTASAYDRSVGKTTYLCGKEASLGMPIFDGKLKVGIKAPLVTEVEGWPDTEGNKPEISAGWVHSFVFKDDDALDLLDLLYEYQTVGFAMVVKKCGETKNFKPGNIVFNLETRGLDRAMRRIK